MESFHYITLYWNFDIPEVLVGVGAVERVEEGVDADAQSADAAALSDHHCSSGNRRQHLNIVIRDVRS